MAFEFVGTQLVTLSFMYLVVQAAAVSEIPGSCPLNSLSCGSTTLENGDTVAMEPKLVTSEDVWLPELGVHVTHRLICKLPACLSSPCENGDVCTETLEGFNCTCQLHGSICASSICPDSWLYFQGSCYGFIQNRLNFNQSLVNCRSFTNGTGQADLVSIHSQEEMDFVFQGPRLFDYTYIGLYQPNQGNTKQFVWSDGAPVTYTAWYPGQPDNITSQDNCVIMYPGIINQWLDHSCTHYHTSICKIVLNALADSGVQSSGTH